MKPIPLQPKGTLHLTKASIPSDQGLRFSFKFFDNSDPELCPPFFQKNYTQNLMERLREVSKMTPQEFVRYNKSLRNHPHDWTKTSRPQGFQHLNDYYQGFQGWQFQLSSNEHGRVHGFLVSDVFHVVWLDRDHRLYPGNP